MNAQEESRQDKFVTLIGAGAVGLNLAARLASCGTPIRLFTRRPEVAAKIAHEGLRLIDPATQDQTMARIEPTADLKTAVAPGTGPVIICVRTGETEELAGKIHAIAPQTRIASAQNDVENEGILARHFQQVAGIVLRQTCTLQDSRTVLATGQGRIVIGDHPDGFGSLSAELADRFEAAGFDVGRSHHISSDKWLKLIYNCLSAVNALIRKADHSQAAFVEIKIRLIQEAQSALALTDLDPRSCDGRDRNIHEEINQLRQALADGTSGRNLPLYNACWVALQDPNRPLEADRYHERIIEMAEQYDLPSPSHRVIRDAVTRARTECTGPECLKASDVLNEIERLSSVRP